MLARVEASLAAVADIKSHQMQQAHHQPQFKPDLYPHDMSYMNNAAAAAKPHFSFNSKLNTVYLHLNLIMMKRKTLQENQQQML